MPLEIPVVHQLGQHVLHEGGDGAGVEAQLFRKDPHEVLGEYHVPHAEGGGDGLGEGVEVDHVVVGRQGEQSLGGLGGHRKLGFVIVLNDVPPAVSRPVHVLVALGGRGRHAAGVAAVGGGVENVGGGGGQGAAVDARLHQREEIVTDLGGAVDLLDHFVGGRLNGEHAASAHQLYDQSVEVFRPRADDDLGRIHRHASVADEIPPYGLPQLLAAAVGGLFQQGISTIRQHAAHGLAQHRQGEIGVGVNLRGGRMGRRF